jgi:hypothetical protein
MPGRHRIFKDFAADESLVTTSQRPCCGPPWSVWLPDITGPCVPPTDPRHRWYAQRQSSQEHSVPGLVRTVTAVLTSSSARPCIDVTPIPAPTNEMGMFETAFEHVVQAYAGLDLFRLVTYDAGACSAPNALAVLQRGCHHLLGLKGNQADLLGAARQWLGTTDRGWSVKHPLPDLLLCLAAEGVHGKESWLGSWRNRDARSVGLASADLRALFRVRARLGRQHGRRQYGRRP